MSDKLKKSKNKPIDIILDFGCGRHNIDYRIACEECQEKYKLFIDFIKKQSTSINIKGGDMK